jgi:hypothetical protein
MLVGCSRLGIVRAPDEYILLRAGIAGIAQVVCRCGQMGHVEGWHAGAVQGGLLCAAPRAAIIQYQQ